MPKEVAALVTRTPENVENIRGPGLSSAQAARLLGVTPARISQLIKSGEAVLLGNGRIDEAWVRSRWEKIHVMKLEGTSVIDGLLFSRFAERDEFGGPRWLPAELVVSLAAEGKPIAADVVFSAFKRFVRMRGDEDVMALIAERAAATARREAADADARRTERENAPCSGCARDLAARADAGRLFYSVNRCDARWLAPSQRCAVCGVPTVERVAPPPDWDPGAAPCRACERTPEKANAEEAVLMLAHAPALADSTIAERNDALRAKGFSCCAVCFHWQITPPATSETRLNAEEASP